MSNYPEALAYLAQAANGEVPANRYLKLLAERSLQEYALAERGEGKFIWRQEIYDGFAEFCSRHVVPMGTRSGEIYELQPWQKAISALLFCWYMRDDPKQRRFTAVMLHIARRNGKTQLAALWMYYELMRRVDTVHMKIISSKLRNSNAAYKHISEMYANNFMDNLPPLAITGTGEMTTGGLIQNARTLSSITKAPGVEVDGQGLTVALIDEAALLKRGQAGLISKMATAMSDQRSRLLIFASTAQEDAQLDGPYHARLLEAMQVLEGRAEDDRLLPILFMADPEDLEGDNCYSDAAYLKANPSAGYVLPADAYKDLVHNARKNQRERWSYCRLTLNCFTGLADQWLEPSVWYSYTNAVEEINRTGRVFIGFDIGQRKDLTALCILYDHGDGTYDADFKCFTPQANYDSLTQEFREIYDLGLAEKGGDGTLEISGLEAVAMEDITEFLCELRAERHIELIVGDPTQAQGFLALARDEGLPIFDSAQTAYAMSPRVDETEALFGSGALKVTRSPFIAWQIANTAALRRNKGGQSYRFLSKLRTTAYKMDAAIALANAVGALDQKDASFGLVDFHVIGGAPKASFTASPAGEGINRPHETIEPASSEEVEEPVLIGLTPLEEPAERQKVSKKQVISDLVAAFT